jgi:eukaryotic-like serine/threonine-protein kinase
MGACNRAAELNDQLPAIYITLGRIHDGTGKHELALQEFQRALDLDHRNADALLGLADSYASVGRVQEAEETYKRAADMRPESWNGLYRLGLFYFQQRRYQDAAEQLRKAVELTPDNAQAHSGLGITLAQLTLLDEAEAELKKSIEIQPSYFAFSNLGIVYYQQRRWGDAAAMWNKALQLNRSDFRVWANLALAYEWLDQKPQAENAYREELSRLEPVAKLKPDEPSLQCELGRLYSRQHLRTKALALVRSALARAPDDPELLSCAGETYNTLGDHQQAVAYLASALENGLPLIELEQSPTLHKLLADPKLQMAHADRGATPNRP